MNILLISSFVYLTIQQCQEIEVAQCNGQLRSGLLPTYLFAEVFSPGLPSKFSTPVQIKQNGWILTADKFEGQAIIDDQTYTGQQGIGEAGQITVSNPTILIEVGFLFSNGTIQNGQGVAVLESVSSASYTFAINTKTNPYSYKFAYVSSTINFNNAQFKAVYANFPHEIGQIQEILTALNTNNQIQTALTTYYTSTQLSGLKSTLTRELANFEIISGQTSTKTYKYGSQKFTYQVVVNNVQIQYAPVTYAISAVMNIQQLQVQYICNNPITLTCVAGANTNVEQISMDQIINSFNYAFQQNYFNTVLNPSNWKVPFFSWSTGGLQNIMNNVYTQYAYASQIGGSCTAVQASYVTSSTQYFTVAMTFTCTLTVNPTPILVFTVDFQGIEVELDFSRVKEAAAFKIKNVNPGPPNIQLQQQGTFNIDNPALVEWYIQEAIDKSFVGQRFFSGFIESQRDLESQDITYSIQEGVITITNIKK
ncbi:unnamed protein product (macronuclear) [Paramecium tetraurelia]|uniref:H-type lectin domain-containing protein n=1 Tax=Paramecium tetraurelia TaxID=5888 RepID=A0C4Q5_PARTE|nr:uncharacterized protein GSPATT00006271001 [Paramecium tetraurelia]CAK65772.1 unnamed protein product [Paramecium tetraurelia]|eukprot:XP_001433169.1 hypothetical protein (macronuclear) [Paramecium tetraurelia strain d4-2]